MGRGVTAGICAVAAVALVGCGGDDEATVLPPEPPDIEALVDYFPDDAFQMHAADFVSQRAELGLPADANPAEYPEPLKEATDEENLFIGGSMPALPYARLAASAYLDPAKSKLSQAIDHTRVVGAASAETPDGSIAVIETPQPFDEIADALEDEGWTRDGDVLTGSDQGFHFVAVTPDEYVVATTAREQVDAILDGDYDGNPAGAMMGGVAGSARFGLAFDAADPHASKPCVTSIAGGGNLGTGQGTVLVDMGDDPDAELVAETAAKGHGVQFGEPDVRGNIVRIPFTDDRSSPGTGVSQAEIALSPLVYDPCP